MTGETIVSEFTTRSSAGSANADSLPTGTLVINGVDDGATVTIANKTTGVYTASVVLPTIDDGDLIQIRVAATVNGVSDKANVWSGQGALARVPANPAETGDEMTLESDERNAIADRFAQRGSTHWEDATEQGSIGRAVLHSRYGYTPATTGDAVTYDSAGNVIETWPITTDPNTQGVIRAGE
jgi:hypothetical protein